MGIGLKTHKLLWGKSGNRCAIEDCRKELVVTEIETDNTSLIGDEAHIVARKKNGPRGVSELNAKERDQYNNLILLCKNHHKIIDDNEEVYTVELLHEIKKTHENWVKENLKLDSKAEFENLIYISYIDYWLEFIDIDNWIYWSTSLIFDQYNFIDKNFFKSFYEIEKYLNSRVWPNKYLELERAFDNFRLILSDLRNVYLLRAKENGNRYQTEKFYKTAKSNFDQEDYDKKFSEWDFHVRLIGDLGLELTRAANYICDQIRKNIEPTFRINEGIILTDSTDFLVVKYRNTDIEKLYPGIHNFMKTRDKRDYNLGNGSHEIYNMIPKK